MCGRFVIATPLVSIFEYFDIHDPRLDVQDDRGPRYNVAPSTSIYIARDTGDARILEEANWGFIPSWAKSLTDGPRPINARAETVESSRLFRRAYEQRRCLIPADGYYEWQARSGRRKQPYYIHRADGQMIAFGGIWETWHEGDEDEIRSAAILTTPASEPMQALHDRMPLVLEQDTWEEWLLGDDPHDLLRPAADDTLAWYAVDPAVGNTRNEGAHLIEQIEED
jgi:putative SOS response-associated peptidase YedK